MTSATHCAAASRNLCRPLAISIAMALSGSVTPRASAPQQRHGGRHGAVVLDGGGQEGERGVRLPPARQLRVQQRRRVLLVQAARQLQPADAGA